jgi:hypothetical protein
MRRTVSLNGNKISNDGDDEGLSVDNDGHVECSANLTVLGDEANFTSANSKLPVLTLKNTTNDVYAPSIKFQNDKGAAGADDDFCGHIYFYGDDDGQTQTLFCEITGQVSTAANGQEGGKLSLGVATHDSEMQYGLILTDGDNEDEIDVTIGNTSTSVTTVAGDLHTEGRAVVFTNDQAAKPDVYLKNTANDQTGAQLIFLKDKGAAGADGDVLGTIEFKGDDDGQNETPYARIQTTATDTTDTSEEGRLHITVATRALGADGYTLATGIGMTGSSTLGQVDVTIGSTTTSTTEIAGILDINGAKITSAGALEIDPGGALSITGQDVAIDATKRLYFDAGGDTYIMESSADNLSIVVGEDTLLKLSEGGGGADNKVVIEAQTPLLFDGGGDTYISEGAADDLYINVGGDRLLQLTDDGDNGNQVWFRASCATFTRIEATFSDTGTIGSGGTDDTDIDFRFSNKYRLELTSDITNVNLIFPTGSGNFTLVCNTNGDHDVTNWKVYGAGESAATTTDVMWAGGSVPAFTNNGTDIVSFYWDGTESQCYGVASLAFATP